MIEQLREHDTSVKITDFQSRKPRFGLGEPIMIRCLQAIKVNEEVMDKALYADITGVVIPGIKHFKAEPTVLCHGGAYIDIEIKQVRHTNGFDLTKDELIKSGISHYLVNETVTFVEWEIS